MPPFPLDGLLFRSGFNLFRRSNLPLPLRGTGLLQGRLLGNKLLGILLQQPFTLAPLTDSLLQFGLSPFGPFQCPAQGLLHGLALLVGRRGRRSFSGLRPGRCRGFGSNKGSGEGDCQTEQNGGDYS